MRTKQHPGLSTWLSQEHCIQRKHVILGEMSGILWNTSGKFFIVTSVFITVDMVDERFVGQTINHEVTRVVRVAVDIRRRFINTEVTWKESKMEKG